MGEDIIQAKRSSLLQVRKGIPDTTLWDDLRIFAMQWSPASSKFLDCPNIYFFLPVVISESHHTRIITHLSSYRVLAKMLNFLLKRFIHELVTRMLEFKRRSFLRVSGPLPAHRLASFSQMFAVSNDCHLNLRGDRQVSNEFHEMLSKDELRIVIPRILYLNIKESL